MDVLFVLNLSQQGKSDRTITICRNDDPNVLAQEFVSKHKLPDVVIPRLAKKIKQQKQICLEEESFKTKEKRGLITPGQDYTDYTTNTNKLQENNKPSPVIGAGPKTVKLSEEDSKMASGSEAAYMRAMSNWENNFSGSNGSNKLKPSQADILSSSPPVISNSPNSPNSPSDNDDNKFIISSPATDVSEFSRYSVTRFQVNSNEKLTNAGKNKSRAKSVDASSSPNAKNRSYSSNGFIGATINSSKSGAIDDVSSKTFDRLYGSASIYANNRERMKMHLEREKNIEVEMSKFRPPPSHNRIYKHKHSKPAGDNFGERLYASDQQWLQKRQQKMNRVVKEQDEKIQKEMNQATFHPELATEGSHAHFTAHILGHMACNAGMERDSRWSDSMGRSGKSRNMNYGQDTMSSSNEESLSKSNSLSKTHRLRSSHDVYQSLYDDRALHQIHKESIRDSVEAERYADVTFKPQIMNKRTEKLAQRNRIGRNAHERHLLTSNSPSSRSSSSPASRQIQASTPGTATSNTSGKTRRQSITAADWNNLGNVDIDDFGSEQIAARQHEEFMRAKDKALTELLVKDLKESNRIHQKQEQLSTFVKERGPNSQYYRQRDMNKAADRREAIYNSREKSKIVKEHAAKLSPGQIWSPKSSPSKTPKGETRKSSWIFFPNNSPNPTEAWMASMSHSTSTKNQTPDTVRKQFAQLTTNISELGSDAIDKTPGGTHLPPPPPMLPFERVREEDEDEEEIEEVESNEDTEIVVMEKSDGSSSSLSGDEGRDRAGADSSPSTIKRTRISMQLENKFFGGSDNGDGDDETATEASLAYREEAQLPTPRSRTTSRSTFDYGDSKQSLTQISELAETKEEESKELVNEDIEIKYSQPSVRLLADTSSSLSRKVDLQVVVPITPAHTDLETPLSQLIDDDAKTPKTVFDQLYLDRVHLEASKSALKEFYDVQKATPKSTVKSKGEIKEIVNRLSDIKTKDSHLEKLTKQYYPNNSMTKRSSKEIAAFVENIAVRDFREREAKKKAAMDIKKADIKKNANKELVDVKSMKLVSKARHRALNEIFDVLVAGALYLKQQKESAGKLHEASQIESHGHELDTSQYEELAKMLQPKELSATMHTILKECHQNGKAQLTREAFMKIVQNSLTKSSGPGGGSGVVMLILDKAVGRGNSSVEHVSSSILAKHEGLTSEEIEEAMHCTDKPTLFVTQERTERLASKAHSKMLQVSIKGKARADVLNEYHDKYLERKAKMREEYIQEAYGECTFQPKLATKPGNAYMTRANSRLGRFGDVMRSNSANTSAQRRASSAPKGGRFGVGGGSGGGAGIVAKKNHVGFGTTTKIHSHVSRTPGHYRTDRKDSLKKFAVREQKYKLRSVNVPSKELAFAHADVYEQKIMHM